MIRKLSNRLDQTELIRLVNDQVVWGLRHVITKTRFRVSEEVEELRVVVADNLSDYTGRDDGWRTW